MTPSLIAECTGATPERAAMFAGFLTAAMDEFDIDTPVQQAAFLAQVGHESGGLHYTTEIWGPTAEQRRYEPPCVKAVQLGNTHPGDGRRYRGHGLIQITGRMNHARMGHALGVDLERTPELLAWPKLAARSAACFWHSHGLNEEADAGDFVRLTRRINGGTNGLADRQRLWAHAKAALGVPA